MSKAYEGKFADYLAESDTVHDIEIELSGKTVTLPVPTRTQMVAYMDASTKEGLTAEQRNRAQWEGLLGKKLAEKVIDHFDEEPFYKFIRFRKFVEVTWFGRGADDVEGKS